MERRRVCEGIRVGRPSDQGRVIISSIHINGLRGGGRPVESGTRISVLFASFGVPAIQAATQLPSRMRA